MRLRACPPNGIKAPLPPSERGFIFGHGPGFPNRTPSMHGTTCGLRAFYLRPVNESAKPSYAHLTHLFILFQLRCDIFFNRFRIFPCRVHLIAAKTKAPCTHTEILPFRISDISWALLFPFKKPKLRNTHLGRYRHMDMIRIRFDFYGFRPFPSTQIPKYCADLQPLLFIKHFPPVLGRNCYMMPAIPLCMR